MAAPSERMRRPLRFLAVGVANTAIDVAIFLGLTGLSVPVIPANMISTSVALVFSFVANRAFTFRAGSGVAGQALRFAIVTLIGLWVLQPLVIWLVAASLAPVMTGTAALLVAKLAATAVSLTWNYLLYGLVVFRTDKRGGASE